MAPSGEILITSESTGQLWNTCIWDPYSGTTIATFKGGSSAPRSLALLGGQYVIAAIANKPLIHMWPLQKMDQHDVKMIAPGKISTLCVSPDGKYCVAAVTEKIYIWEVCSGNLLISISRHYQAVTCLKFTNDGSHFISAGDDNLVLVWSLPDVLNQQSNGQSVEPKHVWMKHSLPVTDVCVGCGGPQTRVATVSLDHTCKLWDIISGEMLFNITFDTSLTSVVLDSAESTLFVGCSNGHIYQVSLFEKPVHFKRHNQSDGDYISFNRHSKEVSCLDISLDGSLLVSGSQDGNVKIWDISSKQCIRTIPHKGPIVNALIVPTPGALLGDAKPNLPVQPFKRQLFIPEPSIRHTIPVRIQGNIEDSQCNDDDTSLIEEYMVAMNDKDDVSTERGKTTNGSEIIELRKELERIKKINAELYKFSVAEILNNQNGTG
ncbi:unnamed protein product [Owenia fusiformis]|uniref:WD repeat-containing protein 18 n=1 Tax=Owenia fusiformis TaxID=6347 RepID=A0A8S4MVA2_OWEFU|nr:unnamed protein product [Owenia fusiformis]